MELEEAQSLIFGALRALNEELGEDGQIALSTQTALFGIDAAIDSLALVSLIVDVESAVSERLGREITLTDDRAMSREVMPFASVGTLSEYIVELSQGE
jgi:acyl carrier protein